MGVIEMTRVSYFFVAMAVVFGCVSVVMYFVLDIRRCWRIVRGTSSVVAREKSSVGGVSSIVVSNMTKQDSGFNNQRTEKLVPDNTEILFTFEETLPPATMTLVQDIVMTDAVKTGVIMADGGMDAERECQ